VAGLNWLIGYKYTYKQTIKHAHSLPLQRPHTITRVNNNIKMDSIIAGSMIARIMSILMLE